MKDAVCFAAIVNHIRPKLASGVITAEEDFSVIYFQQLRSQIRHGGNRFSRQRFGQFQGSPVSSPGLGGVSMPR